MSAQRKTFLYSGFTFIELLATVSIVTVLAVVVVANYRTFSAKRTVKNVAEELKGCFVLAQKSAQAGKKTCAGVYLGTQIRVSESAGVIYSRCEGEVLGDIKACEFSDAEVVFIGGDTINFNVYGIPDNVSIVDVEKSGVTWQVLVDTSGVITVN